MMSRDIKELNANYLGKDYVIGDLHGQSLCLEKALVGLTSRDRLFIVGDLFDKGRNSAEVMRIILEDKKLHPRRIHVVRGNHEKLCQATIRALEYYACQLIACCENETPVQLFHRWNYMVLEKDDFEPQMANISFHLRNGGAWLMGLFWSEVINNHISLATVKVNDITNGSLTYNKTSLVKKIYDYLIQLPYIIYVNGSKPFCVVHADMPFSDEVLQQRIESSEPLSKKEASYALHARPVKVGEEIKKLVYMKQGNRSATSILAYTGHTVTCWGKLSPQAVRRDSNVINLDVGSYASGVSLRVNHTDNFAEYVGPNVEFACEDYPSLTSGICDVIDHLVNNGMQSSIVESINQRYFGFFDQTVLDNDSSESTERMKMYANKN